MQHQKEPIDPQWAMREGLRFMDSLTDRIYAE